MNQQYKFRLWCEGFEHMMPWEIISQYPFKDLEVFFPKHHLMIWTGSEDQRKIEIYEGDILKINDDDEEYITHVRYELGTLCVDFEKINQEYDFITISWLPEGCDIEVIGNIHQNPELLK